jgi:nucleoside phosphorylase
LETPVQEGDDQGRTPRLLILTARPDDYEGMISGRDTDKRLHQNHPYHYMETPRGNLRLTHVGMGEEETRDTLRKLGGLLDPDFLLIAGTAGALKEDFSRQDVFLPTAVRDEPLEQWLHPPTDILQWATGILRNYPDHEFDFRSGPLYSSAEPIVEPTSREALHENTGALAVDMETCTILRNFVHEVDDPPAWTVVRVLSDTFEDDSFNEIKENQSRASKQVSNILEALIDNLTNV